MVGPQKPVLYAELSATRGALEDGPPFMKPGDFVTLNYFTGNEGPDGGEDFIPVAAVVLHYYGETDDSHCIVKLEATMTKPGRPPMAVLWHERTGSQGVFARFYHYREAALRRLPAAPVRPAPQRSTTITTATIAAPPPTVPWIVPNPDRWQALAGLESFGVTIVDPRILPMEPKLRLDDEPRPEPKAEPQPTWDPDDLVPPITSQEYMEKITSRK